MTSAILYKPVGDYRDEFKSLDGDIDAVDNIDKSVDIGINPPSYSSRFRCGRAVDTTRLPTKALAKGRKRKLADYFSMKLAQFCSPAFRDLVEELEPGVHQFEPLTLVWNDGSEAGRYFWFTPCQRIKTLHQELLYPPIYRKSGLWDQRDESGVRVKNPRFVFSRQLIGNHHIWCDPQMDGMIYVSDRFEEMAKARGIAGIRFAEEETV